MESPRNSWRATTHDWSADLDLDHLALIRREPDRFAPGGVLHLVLEVLAYAEDEARYREHPKAVVTLDPDGSVSVSDDGRGTDTRLDERGCPVRKPVMATQDLRFFDSPAAPTLADGRPRRGMSVVAALSAWLVHTNRRLDGSWTQRYEHGVPVTELVATPTDATTGTTVRFLPDPALVDGRVTAEELARLLPSAGSPLSLTIDIR